MLIFVNNDYGIISWKQAAKGFPNFGTTFNKVGFVNWPKLMAPRARASKRRTIWRRRWKPLQKAAACMWSKCRSIYEEVYLHTYKTVSEPALIGRYVSFYNTRRQFIT
ncbi:hypothetical protein RLEG3_02720 (plasmid) [Rhizobium leguminosarum bv. trifolii WSM1689]|nr:hypothetical protein RLEG3_02720 [Rhizobium leguminosarum bv. trifolii WSM1689]